jgi:coproporphyrinogen III oxidase-like Fe-S oxidoreductase
VTDAVSKERAMKTGKPATSAQSLASVDQLPVYGQGPKNSSIQAAELFPRIATEIAGETNKDLLVYLHVPFCQYKCSFCDWVADLPTSVLISGPDVRQTYVDALCRQIRHLGPQLMEAGYVPRYIYWGGGTPSRLDGTQIRRIMAVLGESIDLSRLEEHVMEVTPDSLTPEKLIAMKESGVARISMGVQSFNQEELRKTGRGHTPEQADRAVEMMRAVGIDNFNLDFIVAFPDQSLSVLRQTLERAVAHAPRHLTAYIYRPTPSTTMAKRRRNRPQLLQASSHMKACFELTQEVLGAAGYQEYSLGYFSRSEADRCAGEMYYFHLKGDWMGFGGGAVSVLGHHRLKNSHANLHRFMEYPLSFDSCERLQERQVEAAIYTLRQSLATEVGVNFENFRRFFGFPFGDVRNHPTVKAYLGYYRYCGAEFRETETNLSISPETRAKAYINVWAKAGTRPERMSVLEQGA